MKKLSLNDYRVNFWVRHKGKVTKISLKTGETKKLYIGYWHDEGYRSEVETFDLFEVDGVLSVTNEIHTYNSDCDGPHEYHSVYVCPIGELHSGNYVRSYTRRGDFKRHIPKQFPLWREVDSYQRDFFAESMNY